jgi:hypothetical protein
VGWSVAHSNAQTQIPDPNQRIPYSDFIVSGKSDMRDVIQPTYDEINKAYGLNEKQED